MSLEYFIINAYCLIDDVLNEIMPAKGIRQRGFRPSLSEAEVITMELVGEFMGYDTDSGIWRYFCEHWSTWFPGLGSRANFAKHAANLWQIKQKVQRKLAQTLNGFNDKLHMADGFPMPICKFKRSVFSKLFQEEAAYGYCATKSETYYGFKGNIMSSSQGVVTGITVTPADRDERESLWDILADIQGLLIADKGLLGQAYQQQVRQETGINLQTPLRANMKEHRGKDCNRWLVSTRRLVETVIGQLTERFHIQKVRARDLWHLTNRIVRKVLAHTVGIWINIAMGYSPFQFECLEIAHKS